MFDFITSLCEDKLMIWDYSKTEYQKQAAADLVWHLERLINYGLGEEKLDRELVKNIYSNFASPKIAGFFGIAYEELKNFFCGSRSGNRKGCLIGF